MKFSILITLLIIGCFNLANGQERRFAMNNKQEANYFPLRYWFWWPIRTLDTFEADTPPVMQVARNIYATLVSDFIDGKVQGILAKDWQIDSTGKVWRFILRTDLKFDDGTLSMPLSRPML